MPRDPEDTRVTSSKIEDFGPETLERLRKLLVLGNFRGAAAPAVGISARTLSNWLKRADKGEEKYQKIRDLVESAEAESEVLLVNVIWVAAVVHGHWQAAVWLLEHGVPKRHWGYKAVEASASIAGTEDGRLNVSIVVAPSPEAATRVAKEDSERSDSGNDVESDPSTD